MKNRLLILALILPALLLHADDGATTLKQANRDYASHTIQAALEGYQAAWSSLTAEDDRLFAARRAGMLLWRVFARHDEARAWLNMAILEVTQPSDLYHELSRLERDAGNMAAASSAARKALTTATRDDERRRARTALVDALLQQPMQSACNGTVPAREDLSYLSAELPGLHSLVADKPGLTETSKALLHGALLTGDGAMALLAWESYFQFSPDVPAGAILDKARTKLDILNAWQPASSDGIRQTRQVIDGLVACGMFEEALAVAGAHPVGALPQKTRDDLAYASVIRDLRQKTDEYYRQTALGSGDFAAYYQYVVKKFRSLWENGSWARTEFPYEKISTLETAMNNRDAIEMLRTAFMDRFNVTVALGPTAGYPDLHMGHVVYRETREVQQYGHSADFTFIQLDLMVSNGFQSWAWDYDSQHGGWAREDAMVQVRPAYANGAILAWERLTDPQRILRRSEQLARAIESDQKQVEDNPVAYYPSVNIRMQDIGLKRLLDNLKAENLEGEALRTRFISRLNVITAAYSIYAHEGRHVIDKRLGISDGAELEYRAKLSQVAFSDYPFLALSSGIYSSNLGDQTPHGQANQRLLTGLLDWMKDHAGEIDSLDPQAPMVLQIPALTPGQLKLAMMSLDPLAGNQ